MTAQAWKVSQQFQGNISKLINKAFIVGWCPLGKRDGLSLLESLNGISSEPTQSEM